MGVNETRTRPDPHVMLLRSDAHQQHIADLWLSGATRGELINKRDIGARVAAAERVTGRDRKIELQCGTNKAYTIKSGGWIAPMQPKANPKQPARPSDDVLSHHNAATSLYPAHKVHPES